MTVSLITNPVFRAFDASGVPLAGGLLYTYGAGGVTLLATYTDSTGLVLNANPVVLDSVGQASVWLGNNAYKFLLKDANGVTQLDYPVDNITRYTNYSELNTVSASLTTFENNLLSKVYGSQGASLIGYNYSSDGIGRNLDKRLQDSVSIRDFGAIGDGSSHPLSGIYGNLAAAQAVYPFVTSLAWELDHAATQAALNTGKMVYAPRGVYLIDTTYGLILNNGYSLCGDGILNTVFLTKQSGGSLADLQNYVKGSVFKRSFTLGVANNYVTGCYLSDFSVIMKPQIPINTSGGFYAPSYIQIGVDLRHITRSKIENVFSGNIPIPGCIYSTTPSTNDAIQGYGFTFGTQSSSDVAYAGGEVNEVNNCFSWGAFKGFVSDDSSLMLNSGGSSAHSTRIINCDTQACHNNVSQESRYTAGFKVSGGVHQFCVRQAGNANATFILGISGYCGNYLIDYIEAGTACDRILLIGSLSSNNIIELPYFSHTSSAISGGKILDTGTFNVIKTFVSTAITGGETTEGGAYYELFNQAYRRVIVSFSWNGSSIVVNSNLGILNISRGGVGDYTLTLANAAPNAFWIPGIILNTGVSGHGGTYAIISKSASNIRFVTYSQNGGTTTQIDPIEVCFSGAQN